MTLDSILNPMKVAVSLLTLDTLNLLNLIHKMLETEGYIADLTRKPFAVKNDLIMTFHNDAIMMFLLCYLPYLFLKH